MLSCFNCAGLDGAEGNAQRRPASVNSAFRPSTPANSGIWTAAGSWSGWSSSAGGSPRAPDGASVSAAGESPRSALWGSGGDPSTTAASDDTAAAAAAGTRPPQWWAASVSEQQQQPARDVSMADLRVMVGADSLSAEGCSASSDDLRALLRQASATLPGPIVSISTAAPCSGDGQGTAAAAVVFPPKPAASVTAAAQPAAASCAVAVASAELAKSAALKALHPAVRAHLEGTLGVAFSGGGFRYGYFLGVGQALLELGLICRSTRVSGASSGAIAAVLLKNGFDAADVLQSTLNFAREIRSRGVFGRLGPLLRAYLRDHLPSDAGDACGNSTYFAITRVWPSIRTRLYNEFSDTTALIEGVLASCHLPAISDGRITTRVIGEERGLHIDGGLLSVVTAPPGTTHDILVCSMPSRQIAALPSYITRPAPHEISITPDSFQDWPFSRRETLALARDAPTDSFIIDMYQRGLDDARAWAEAVGFTRRGWRVWPTARELGRAPPPVWRPTAGGVGAAESPLGAAAAMVVAATP